MQTGVLFIQKTVCMVLEKKVLIFLFYLFIKKFKKKLCNDKNLYMAQNLYMYVSANACYM